LQGDIAELLTQPVGPSSDRPVVRHESFRGQTESCARPQRASANVEGRRGELFQVGSNVTNLETDSRAVVRFYRRRGTVQRTEALSAPAG